MATDAASQPFWRCQGIPDDAAVGPLNGIAHPPQLPDMHMTRLAADRFHCVVLACVALALPALALADKNGMRVHRFERWQPTISRDAANRATAVRFSAYGRQFRMQLQPNTRLEAAAAGSAIQLYRGSLVDAPGSWVRLSVNGSVMRGMFWDGSELYLVESASVADAAAPDNDTVLVRLADTELDPPWSRIDETIMVPQDVAPRDMTPQDGQQAYGALMNELTGAAPIMQAATASARLEVSALGDAAFRAEFASDQQAQDALLTRMNNVDGIFSSQVGVEIDVASVNIGDSLTASLSATTVPSTLLNELSTLRQQTPVLNSRGLTHLLTGRPLDGTTVGIAFTKSLCSRTYSASLNETHTNAALDSLIAAHEIGHVFGAPHDGEGACASTSPALYIMAPTLGPGVSTFSQCSLDTMAPQVQAASCLLALSAPDIAVAANLGTQTTTAGTTSNWQIAISNTGGRSATGARATVQITPDLSITSAQIDGGTCTIQSSLATCDLPAVAAGSSQMLQLGLSSPTAGNYSVQAQVVAADDANAANNSGTGTLTVNAATAPATPRPTGSSGGGGGGLFHPLLLLLGVMTLRRRPDRDAPTSSRDPTTEKSGAF